MKAIEIVDLVDKVRLKKCLSMHKIASLLGISYVTYVKASSKKSNQSLITLSKMINYLQSEGYDVELERD